MLNNPQFFCTTHTQMCVLWKKHSFITVIKFADVSSLNCVYEALVLWTDEGSLGVPTIFPRITQKFFTLMMVCKICMSKHD